MSVLKEISTKAPKDLDKKLTKEETSRLVNELDELQNLLYAEGKHAVLVILQGMDASGKDGAIKKVFGQLNPQGVMVRSFKTPTEEESSHDFLWRIHQHAPQKRMIEVFNRSQYEDVLITRVHGWCDDATAKKRFRAINDFENLLSVHNATVIFKFYLHISREEQADRFREREEDPSKQWKYNEKDYEEAKRWDDYMKMYEDVFEKCNEVPWTIVPSDQNWFKEYIIAKTVVDRLKSLDMKYPQLIEKGP
ncbi:MAG TPA: PPK2 family polyphosphate kinase [Flavisolibacter sp.]|nr:PPK2 family polyphosphate kinase [Flavisolibacter sp.]